MDLKENGRNILVTDENKDEYIQLIAEYRLTTSIKPQLDAFLEGFYEIVPKEHISIVSLPYIACLRATLDLDSSSTRRKSSS